MKILQGLKKYPVEEMILHCAAVPAGWYYKLTPEEMLATIRSWHTLDPPKGRGWSDIGYHFVIAPSGVVLAGRPVDKIPASVIGHNAGKLAVLMIERNRIDRIGKFHDYFNEQQRRAVRKLAQEYEIKRIRGHNDYAPRLCPGFKVKQEFFL